MSDNVSLKDGAGVLFTAETIQDPVSLAHSTRVYGRDLLAKVSATPTVTASSAYVSGYAVGGLLSFTDAVRASGGFGEVKVLNLADKALQTPDLDLFLFDSAPSAPTNHAAYSPTDADMLKCVGVVKLRSTEYTSLPNNAVGQALTSLHFQLASGTTLYGVLVTRGTPTFAATSDIVVNLMIRQN